MGLRSADRTLFSMNLREIVLRVSRETRLGFHRESMKLYNEDYRRTRRLGARGVRVNGDSPEQFSGTRS